MNKSAVFFSAIFKRHRAHPFGWGHLYCAGKEPVAAEQDTISVDLNAGTEPIVAIDPALEQEILTQEAAYQDLIAQANARLAEQQAVETQVSTPTPSFILQITAQEAAVFASRYLGKSQVYSVEAVDFNGQVVYRVTFSNGDVVFVSVYGDILGLEEAPRQNNSGQAVASSGEDDDDHGRHSEYDDDDD